MLGAGTMYSLRALLIQVVVKLVLVENTDGVV